MNKQELQDAVDDGAVHFSAIFEMVGKPKEHVEKTFTDYIEEIKKDSQFTVLESDIADVTDVEESEGLFSTFCEMEVLAKGMSHVYDFCFKFMPASIEIIDPEQTHLTSNEATGLINDFIAKMHERDMEMKKSNQAMRLLSQNVNILIENLIMVLLKFRPLAVPEIAKGAGIEESKVPLFIEKLTKDGKIEADGDKFKLVNK